MNLTAENTTAKNGTPIHSCVTLDIDAVGHVARPFRAEVVVGGVRLFTSHCTTRDEASQVREQMHAAYMRTHEN